MILVVDDSPLLAKLTHDFLEYSGFKVKAVLSGAEALRALASEPQIEAIILDVEMPGMNGLETAKCAREIRPEIKILLVSGQPLPNFYRNDSRHPFLMKPFDLNTLEGALRGLGVHQPQ